jgi:F5/8 type C domain-containing protein
MVSCAATSRMTSLQSSHTRSHLALARATADIADRIMNEAPFPGGPNVLAAMTLYREAAFWALTAEQEGPIAQTMSEALGRASPNVAAEAGAAEKGLSDALTRSYVASADLNDAARVAEVGVLQRFLRRSIARLEGYEQDVRRSALRRWMRPIFLAAGVLVAGAALLWVNHRDLAANRPWRASSTLPNCDLAFNTCQGESVNIFFHTLEEDSPWVEFDLGSVQSVSRVIVRNRQDCCAERAVPLAIEVSRDGTSYTEVARRQDPFTEWDAKFRPVRARYVRAKALRRTILHFEGVAVR